nr:hypothetical protein [Anaerolineae bacterium]
MPELIQDFAGLFIIILGVLLFFVFTILARRGFRPTLRPLSGYDTMHMQVGQAIESGGRVHLSLGPNNIIDEKTGVTLAAMSILDIVAEESIIGDLSPVATTSDATALPVIGDTIRRTYKRKDVLDKYDTKAARLVAFDPYALAGSAMSIIADDDVRANVLVGSFGPEVALMAEAGLRNQIPQTIGSDQVDCQAAAYSMADHILIGEELFVAGAYLRQTPSDIGSLATQDVLRWIIVGLIAFNVVLQTMGLLS